MTDSFFVAPTQSTRPFIRWRTRLPDTGEFWTFVLAWNDRSQAWSFGIESADGTTLQQGIRICTGMDLVVGSSPDLPPGQIFAVDTEGTNLPPPRDAWRSHWQLRYRPAADQEAAAGTSFQIFPSVS